MTRKKAETALIPVIEEPIVVPPVPFRTIIPLPSDKETIDQVFEKFPDQQLPYYLLASDGFYKHTRTELGRGFTKTREAPVGLGKFPNFAGTYFYDAPMVPKELVAQIVSFFRRIYDKYNAEAEVYLTFNIDTKQWRVFIPTQKVSGGSVNSVIEPSDIAPRHIIIGTMHSHCNFSAFHSGTDMADAAGKDGVHFTIGFLKREMPEVVAMVSIEDRQFHYKPESIADFSDLDCAVAPLWWDNYVMPNYGAKDTPQAVGFSLFEKYKKTEITTYGHGGRGYNGYAPHGQAYQGNYGNREWGWGDYYDDGYVGKQINDIKKLSAVSTALDDRITSLDDRIKAMGGEKGKDGVIRFPARTDPQVTTVTEPQNINLELFDLFYDDGLVTDEELDEAILTGEADNPTFWKLLMLKKLNALTETLEFLGLDVRYSVQPIKTPIRKRPQRSFKHTQTKKLVVRKTKGIVRGNKV